MQHLDLAVGRRITTNYKLTTSVLTSVWWLAKRITFSPALRDLEASSQYLIGVGVVAK